MEISKLNKLWHIGQEFLGVEYSIMGGAMSWISEHSLVAAISNSGAFGIIASGSMDGQLLEKEILLTAKKTSKPFGVNIIIMNPKLEELIDVCGKNKVSHVILAGGLPTAKIIDKLHNYNIKVLAFIPNLSIAKRFIKSGIDALIIEGSEAGGHIGSVSTSVLAQEILPELKDVPIFIAGGIAHGAMMAKYLELGAVGVQIGTALVCTDECIAHDNFKQAFIRASARDAQSTVQIDPNFPVIPVRALINKGSKGFIELQSDVVNKFKAGSLSKYDAQMQIEHYWVGALKRAVIDGDIENGSLMAGQCVGMVNEIISVDKLIQKLIIQSLNYIK